MDPKLTWQAAKASTQKKELEIAALFPKDTVAKVEQRPTGHLMSCKQEGAYSWVGGTTVVLVPNTQQEPIIRIIESHYKGGRFSTIVDRRTDGDLRIQLYDQATQEGYLIGNGLNELNSMDITSYSQCFTPPKDTWPNGDF